MPRPPVPFALFLAYLRGYLLATLPDTGELLDAFEALRDEPEKATALSLGAVDRYDERKWRTAEDVAAEVAGLMGMGEIVEAEAAPPPLDPAVRMLTAEGAAERKIVCVACRGYFYGEEVAERSNAFAPWAHQGGCPLVIVMPRPKGWPLWQVDGFTGCGGCGAMLRGNVTVIEFAREHEAHGRGVDHLAGADKMVTPTPEEIEAERVKWNAVSGPLDFWEWLGWDEAEMSHYEDHGTIPARPLRKHEPVEACDGTGCADCECSHPKQVGCVCTHGIKPHPWRKRTEAPVAMPPRVMIAGRRMERSHTAFEAACEVLLAEEQEKIAPDNSLIGLLCDAVRLSREHVDYATTPAVTVPRPGDALRAAVKALVECQHKNVHGGRCVSCWAFSDGGWNRAPLVKDLALALVTP